LEGDVARRIVEFVSSGLAYPSIRRLVFCQLPNCIFVWSREPQYDGVELDLKELMEILKEDGCIDETFGERWYCAMRTLLFQGE
jgi:hypothetical protein